MHTPIEVMSELISSGQSSIISDDPAIRCACSPEHLHDTLFNFSADLEPAACYEAPSHTSTEYVKDDSLKRGR